MMMMDESVIVSSVISFYFDASPHFSLQMVLKEVKMVHGGLTTI